MSSSETKRLLEKERPEAIEEHHEGDDDEEAAGASTGATTSGSAVRAKIRRRQSPPFGTDYGSSASKYGTLDTGSPPSYAGKRSILVETYPKSHITRKQFGIAFIAFLIFAAAVAVTLILGLPRLDAKRTEYYAAKFYSSKVEEKLYQKGVVVVTGGPECSKVGLSLMTQHNGSAIDGALAALFCSLVASPHLTRFDSALSGLALLKATPTAFQSSLSKADLASGNRSISTPSLIATAQNLHARLGGRASWAQILEPAIQLANLGVPASAGLVDVIQSADWSRQEAGVRRIFSGSENGTRLGLGEILSIPGLAETLTGIAQGAGETPTVAPIGIQVAGSQVSASGAQVASTGTRAASTGTPTLTPSTQAPPTSTQAQITSTGTPAASNGTPAASTGTPVASTGTPAASTGTPVSSTGTPTTTTSTQAPPTSTQAPPPTQNTNSTSFTGLLSSDLSRTLGLPLSPASFSPSLTPAPLLSSPLSLPLLNHTATLLTVPAPSSGAVLGQYLAILDTLLQSNLSSIELCNDDNRTLKEGAYEFHYILEALKFGYASAARLSAAPSTAEAALLDPVRIEEIAQKILDFTVYPEAEHSPDYYGYTDLHVPEAEAENKLQAGVEILVYDEASGESVALTTINRNGLLDGQKILSEKTGIILETWTREESDEEPIYPTTPVMILDPRTQKLRLASTASGSDALAALGQVLYKILYNCQELKSSTDESRFYYSAGRDRVLYEDTFPQAYIDLLTKLFAHYNLKPVPEQVPARSAVQTLYRLDKAGPSVAGNGTSQTAGNREGLVVMTDYRTSDAFADGR